MGEALPIARTDRLPWIDYVAEAKARRDAPRRRRGTGWLVIPVAIAAFAGGLFWAGQRGVDPGPAVPVPAASAAAGGQVSIEVAPPAPGPESAPAAPHVPSAAAPSPAAPSRDRTEPRPASEVSIRMQAQPDGEVTAIAAADAAPIPSIAAPAPDDQLIQLGAFTTSRQADATWVEMVERFPLLEGMPKAVVPVRAKRSRRTLYRLRLGADTEEQARLACQILRLDGRSCVVVG
jgi:hypothetical protein